MVYLNIIQQYKISKLMLSCQTIVMCILLAKSSRSNSNESDLENIGPIDENEIKIFFEEKYRFKNDNTSRRFKIADAESITSGERELETVFRAFAVRRIVGGMKTTIKLYPYNVAISRNGKHWCGGSLIDEQWVLTAGHCLESAHDGDKNKLIPFIVRAGTSFHNRGGYQARVNKVFFPEEYVPGNADYDYSLLRLDRPMPIGRNIAVLNLPSKEYNIRADDVLIVTGWGSTDSSGFGNIPERLRFVPVPVMPLQKCQDAYHFYITPRMLCAGYATGGKDACNHDSGGPAVRDGVLIGVVSFGGKKCGDPRSPGVYSKVSRITDWVEKTITKNEAYEVPELRKKIKRARKREKEIQTFKTQVENKKSKLRNFLKNMLNSPAFIELAKRKLIELGLKVGAARRFEPAPAHIVNDDVLDRINLANLIYDTIIGYDTNNDTEILLRTLAMYEVVTNDISKEVLKSQRNSNLLLAILDK